MGFSGRFRGHHIAAELQDGQRHLRRRETYDDLIAAELDV